MLRTAGEGDTLHIPHTLLDPAIFLLIVTYDPVVVNDLCIIPIKPAKLKELVPGRHYLLWEDSELELPTGHQSLEGDVEGLLLRIETCVREYGRAGGKTDQPRTLGIRCGVTT